MQIIIEKKGSKIIPGFNDLIYQSAYEINIKDGVMICYNILGQEIYHVKIEKTKSINIERDEL